eukprot:CAMPEP_0197522062 /NCGR_PEP_ID=MMETSP1318-20131121/7255_1 /TAXON_ID=552666 /ORGANISM="Partenskyella glossopodia, Strain RCC365" /LENGTH=138 /DNA_ID=CAMNT_0043074285 /DNA_START=56 /DNA_END=475 /DNA_ORIENTATION=-
MASGSFTTVIALLLLGISANGFRPSASSRSDDTYRGKSGMSASKAGASKRTHMSNHGGQGAESRAEASHAAALVASETTYLRPPVVATLSPIKKNHGTLQLDLEARDGFLPVLKSKLAGVGMQHASSMRTQQRDVSGT